MTSRRRVALAVGSDGNPRLFAVGESGAIDLTARFSDRWADLSGLIKSGDLGSIDQLCAGLTDDVQLAELRLLPPIPRGGKILCVGVNYPDRAEEYSRDNPPPTHPSIFVRFPESFVGAGEPLIRPTVSEQFDYEGEIAIVIGKRGRHIAQDVALDHISALTLCNEGSVRDWMRHGKFNVTQGKNFDASGALGPWLVPFSGADQIADIELSTRVNGEVRQKDRTSRMLFPFAELVAYISTFTTLEVGDIIITGTPTGAGARQNPPTWLVPGDVVEIRADGIGSLSNPVADEQPA